LIPSSKDFVIKIDKIWSWRLLETKKRSPLVSEFDRSVSQSSARTLTTYKSVTLATYKSQTYNSVTLNLLYFLNAYRYIIPAYAEGATTDQKSMDTFHSQLRERFKSNAVLDMFRPTLHKEYE